MRIIDKISDILDRLVDVVWKTAVILFYILLIGLLIWIGRMLVGWAL